ncbi:MAG: type 1 glutamine amidotransferase [Planctomycetota bacterium]
MATILVLQHSRYEPPRRLGLTLRDQGFKLDIRQLHTSPEEGGDTLPPDLDAYAGLISLGGGQNVDEGHWWIEPECGLIREAHRRELAVIGVCLGAQMVAKALGGAVGKMDKPEAGFCPVSIVGSGQTDRILAGLRWDHHQFQSHGYEITELPPGAENVITSPASKVQCFKAGIRTYAFQFHFELDREGIEALVREEAGIFERAGVSVDEIHTQCDAHYATFARLSDRLCVNLAAFGFAFDELLSA